MGYRILVVDDDASINDMLIKYLKKNGYETASAYSGTEAVLLIERQDFDLVSLDLVQKLVFQHKSFTLVVRWDFRS